MKTRVKELNLDGSYQFGFAMPEKPLFKTRPGLNKKIIEEISGYKGEPEWMREFRLKALGNFLTKSLPTWGGDLSGINFDNLCYYLKPRTRTSSVRGRPEEAQQKWSALPEEIKTTFDRLGIPEAERRYLQGVSAQYDSEVIYHSLQEHLAKQGVIFCDTDTALNKYPEIFRQYFGTVVPASDNKFAALNSACWSGGSFIYVPPGVKVELPLQAYFRINAERFGQFERTLIIAEKGSSVNYVEGCSAPSFSTNSLHSAVVEIIVKPGAKVRYTTVQNWYKNIYNLVTKRALVYGEGQMDWIDCNLGSCLTMKYPSVCLLEPGARGSVLSLAVAGAGQHQDSGGKAIHAAPHTSSTITAKSVSYGGGRSSYRGLVKVLPTAKNSKSHVVCEALLLDEISRSDTYPTMDIKNDTVTIGHEASVSKIGEEQLFYLMSRGLDKAAARALIVNGFLEPIAAELPMEYAVELNRLIGLEMEGSVG